MSFLSNFMHHPPSHPEYQGPPQPPPPWRAEWDGQDQRWFFVNQQTGERSWNFPQQGPGYGGPPGGGYPQQQGYGGFQQQAPQQQSHTGMNVALGVGGGLLAGALLEHEGHKVEERFDRDKYEAENRFDYDRDRVEDRVRYDEDRFDDRVRYDEQRVEDFPNNAARWAGRKEQEVEDIPEDVAEWGGRKVQEVEDIPDDVAGWAGRKEQRVEDFGDDIRDSYDYGRAEQEYRDDERYGDDY